MKTSLKPKRLEKAEDSFRKQLMDGASVIRNSGVLSFILSIFFVVMIGAGIINALIVPFLEDDLHFGAFELGLVMGGSSALGAVGAALLGKKSQIEKPLYLLAGSMVLAGFMVFGLSLSVDLFGVLIFFSLVGLVNVTIAIPSNALLQELVRDELRGRVFAFQSVMIDTAKVIGMIVAGLWAESIGTSRPPLSFAGVFLLIVGTLGFGIIARKNIHFEIDEKRRLRSEAEMESERVEEITLQDIEDSS
ncbi:MAG: MFS transporter [Candidatus Lokiarchaeota archaeon]|nr:MFS transporter [Candidatus Lokiarchaeota archaeon]